MMSLYAPASVRSARVRCALPLILLALCAPAPLAARQMEHATDPLANFDAYVRHAVETWNVPGLAVAVVKDGRTVFAHGYGVRELGGTAPVDEHTLFAIGSTTKALTAASIGMLVDEGKLRWDDPVIRHLPWFQLYDPQATRQVTIRDLLTHRAGLGNADYLWYEQDADTRDILRRLRYVEPAYPIRSSFIYQNLMYAAAGKVIAAASGMAWSEFIRTRILEPVGMNETVTSLTQASRSDDVASPHDRVAGEMRVIENASVDAVASAGAIWSSVHDMARWLAFLLRGCVTESGERLLAEATCDELFEPQTIVTPEAFYPTARLTHPHWTTYGLAWFQEDYEGRKVDFHTGSIDGMVAIAGLLRDEGVGVYVLANRDHTELRHALMYRVFDLYDGDPPRDWSTDLKTLYDGLAARADSARRAADARRVTGTTPSLPLERYAGTYTDSLFGTVEVTLADGALHLSYGKLEGPLEHWNYDTFRVNWAGGWRGSELATFVLDAAGRPSMLRLGGNAFARAEGAAR